jgi:hypothetical protein
MPPFDEHAAHLPPPRADEPASLRREIIDELSDHLICARKREQLAGGSQTAEVIQQRVFDRFGDPAEVARKLWLDWMWEKIMTQRILVGLCALLTVVTCAALAFAWVSINRQHDLIADMKLTSQAQLEQQQKHFERLLAATQNNKAPSDWNPVELRFVKGKDDGPPAEGIKVTVSIKASETGIPDMEAVSNDQGVVRFERVRYGSYTMRVSNTVGESFSSNFTLQPGEGLTRTVVCPEPPTQPSQVFPRIVWPQDLADRPLWFRFQAGEVYRPVESTRWYSPVPMFDADVSRHKEAVIAPDGTMMSAIRQWLMASGQRESDEKKRSAPYVVMQMGSNELYSKRPEGFVWPGEKYVSRVIQVLYPASGITSPDQLPQPSASFNPRRNHQVFNLIGLPSADWSYRIEPGAADKPGTLWLTPTADAIEKVRAALAEIDQEREAAAKAQAEAKKARAARQTPSDSNSGAAAKENTDSK